MARHFLRQHHAMPGHPDEPSPAELAARSPARAGQHSGSSHGCTARARADVAAAIAGRCGSDEPSRGWPPFLRTQACPPVAANVLRDAPSRRFLRFERDPVGAREFGTQIWRSVAATSRAFSRRSDRWIGDFFAPTQSRFVGPTSSACISSTAAPFGMLPVPVRSWTLWLQWDPSILISCSGYRGE
ncbi:putative formin-like protein 18 isoform X1 [Iris pallida]|uniref:Formin-like protein 18 isoform X1 n=1 Tax=Iris pallida TaxID=29817 RepID=A0AAX6F124_IRIPA|nr:putative formin-like protein 18 isoform X1 [Iris pallida]